MSKQLENIPLVQTYPQEWSSHGAKEMTMPSGDKIDIVSGTNLGVDQMARFGDGFNEERGKWVFLDDSDRFDRLNEAGTIKKDLDPDWQELKQKYVETANENSWNIEWLEKNNPKLYIDSGYHHIVTLPANSYPWTGSTYRRSFLGSETLDPRLNYQPLISNLHRSRQKTESAEKYKTAEFSLIDIPYLIDQVPALSEAPHSNKEHLITNLSL